MVNMERLRVPLWLGGVAALTWWVWSAVYAALATALLAFPAAFVFAIAALLSGPPYKVRPRFRWAWRVSKVPREARRSMREHLRRMVFWRIEKIELPGKRFAFFRSMSLLVAVVTFAVTAIVLPAGRSYFSRDLPENLEAVLAYDPSVSTRVYSREGELICSFTTQNRVRVPIDQVPAHVRQAFIAAEDRGFYEHNGIDPVAIVRAALVNFESGETRQGASTITQQVVKQVVLRNAERTYRRKIQEIILAVEIERRMEKDRILEVYLNHIFLGHGAYGIQAAAQTYFGKDVSQLTLAEATLLAGLPRAPSRDSPYDHFDRARRRQAYVLGRMLEEGYATREQVEAALREEIVLIQHEDPLNRTAAPYFCEHVRRELQRMYGYRAVFEEGLTVRTSIDMRMQRAAETSVRRGLIDLERRIGFNGPEGRDDAFTRCDGVRETVPDAAIESAVVASVDRGVTVCVRGNTYPMHPDDAARIARWERESRVRLAVGDRMTVSIETSGSARYALSARRTAGPEHPEALQAALVAADPVTGELRALVGGYDFNESQFNAATQARRQTGSSIKPFVYLAALRSGLTVDDSVIDHPVCYPSASGLWCPSNYIGPNTTHPYLGRVTLRTALARSLNSVSVQLLARVGVDDGIRTMRDLGITSPIERVLPIAIGAAEFTPWEHTFAYAVIAANGREMPRHPGSTQAGVYITQVEDSGGRELFRYEPPPLDDWRQAVPSSDAFALTYLMRGVVEEGTGRRVRELRRPAAGKTGTANDFRDVWFMGYTPDLVVGVWVGRMTPQPIAPNATGGSVALPIWLAFMQSAHPDTPPRDFPVPDDVVLLPGPDGSLRPFQRGRVPAELLSGASSGNFAGDPPF